MPVSRATGARSSGGGGGGVTLRSLVREGPASSLCGMLKVLRIGIVPPANMANLVANFCFPWTENVPFPMYSMCPNGPLMSSKEPSGNDSRYCDIRPPFGNLGSTPLNRIRVVAHGYELTDSKLFQELLGLIGMDCIELFSTVGSSIDENAVTTTGMVFEEVGAVVDVTMDDNPSRVG
ncbi:hypothetical protein Ccrd_025923 [Cynara cardunculus var. scolymus]|uniref:Uncharacterized protein n=1 Tax=Cynara cardunculus var. scolymus TaxID=59895 RepID=A0A103TE07_CYNCS|nr:hypothetical protein Ccrd_025923 [Cynara cardunculus var. scolymus]